MTRLVGTGANQVPTNSDLGSMAFQSDDAVTVNNLTVNAAISTVSFSVAGTGIPVTVNSTDSTGRKITFQDAGVITGYIGTSSALSFFIQNAANSTTTFSVDQSGNTVVAGSITASTLKSTPIGNTGASSGAFTTLSATGATSLAALSATSLDSTPIGNTTTSSGKFTTLSSTGATALAALSATSLDSTPIGNTTASSGKFTTLNASGATALAALSATTGTFSGGVSSPTFTGALSGNATTATTAGNVTGTVAIANGGTGATTAATALTNLGASDVNFTVLKTSATASAVIPSGTTAQRDGSPVSGYLRYNQTSLKFEGYSAGAWGSIGGGSGATGAGQDNVFVENDKYQTTSYTLGQSGLTPCTISIATPAVITQGNTFLGGEEVFFQTSGALPTGLTANTTYFVISTGLTGSAFQVSATRGGTAVATTGTQSGTQSTGKAKSAQMVGPLTVATGATITVPTGQRLIIQ